MKAKKAVPAAGSTVWCIFGKPEPWRATVVCEERGKLVVDGGGWTQAVPVGSTFDLESAAWLACVKETQDAIKAMQAQADRQRKAAMRADAREIEARLRGGAR